MVMLKSGLLVVILCLLHATDHAHSEALDKFRKLNGFLSEREKESGRKPRMHTIFSVECGPYFDWQTVGLIHSYRKSRHPGPITRLLSCTDEALKSYKNMDLAPTQVVPSWTHNPHSGDWYSAINKPKGVVDWVEKSKDAQTVEWVLILDADMIIRAPVTPWDQGAAKGHPVSAYYGYLIGCDNILAKLHTKNPHLCDKVGGFILMHIDDLRKFAPLWLSKTEEVRADKAHYATNITGDIYGQGWISEMYGYSFGAAECGLKHKIDNELMLYPGYEPMEGQDPHLLHYGLSFGTGNWTFGKSFHHSNYLVNECNRLFDAPPFPNQVDEPTERKRRAADISIECVNTLNEGLLIHHATHGCPEPVSTPYIDYLKTNIQLATRSSKSSGVTNKLRGQTEDRMATIARKFLEATSSGLPEEEGGKDENPQNAVKLRDEGGEKVADVSGRGEAAQEDEGAHEDEGEKWAWRPRQAEGKPRIVTLFSVECSSYFDWQTLGLMYSFVRSGQPGPITRLLSCTKDELRGYRGMELAPTLVVPSWNQHPVTGDWYPAINKPVGVNHWLQNSPDADEVDYVIILDADMILRHPILPWELGAEKGKPVSAPYDYLIGCDNILGQLHMKNPSICDKVGGFIVMHIDDLRKFAPLWLSKTEEVRADKAHYATNITGDIYGQGWISEMYGYSFGASDAGLRHTRDDNVMFYPGYMPIPRVDPRVFHYGLPMKVGDWEWDKSKWREKNLAFTCGEHFPDPPEPNTLAVEQETEARRRDLYIIECVGVLNRALREHHRKMGCPKDGEVDVATVDLWLGSPKVPFEKPELKVVVEEGEVIEGFKTVKHMAYDNEEKGLFVTFEGDGRGNEKERKEATNTQSSTLKEVASMKGNRTNGRTESEGEVKERKMKVVGLDLTGKRFGSRISLDLFENPKVWMVLPWVLMVAGFLFALSSKKVFKVLRIFRSNEKQKGKWKLTGKALRFSCLPSLTLPIPSMKSSKDATL